MSSKSRASVGPSVSKPAKRDLPAKSVREFRDLLRVALTAEDDQGRVISSSTWGVYGFFDYDGEPIYIGQTKESLATRIRRHLTNQRTDAVAMRILDTFEVAKVAMWPLWGLAEVAKGGGKADAQAALDAAEYTAYRDAIAESKFGAILNEKIPPIGARVQLPEPFVFELVGEDTRVERGHPDIRIARRAETIARLAAVAHERGEVSDGLRRVLVIQAVRLAFISAVRLAYVEGRPPPDPSAIDVASLVGTVLFEPSDPHGDGPADQEPSADLSWSAAAYEATPHSHERRAGETVEPSGS